jgi:hypothetical protein
MLQSRLSSVSTPPKTDEVTKGVVAASKLPDHSQCPCRALSVIPTGHYQFCMSYHQAVVSGKNALSISNLLK